MKKVLTFKGAALPRECESNDHLNVIYFISKFEQAGRNFMLALGLRNLIGKKTTGVVVLEQKINYFKEVREEDLLHIESTLIKVEHKAFTILHEMYCSNTNDLVSTMRVVMVLFDRVNRSALPFPEDKRIELLKKI